MKATLKLNSELNCIEIYFETYPGKDIIDKLRKMKNWRWHKVKKCWYAKQTEENLNFAKTICDGDIEKLLIFSLLKMFTV